MASLTSTTSLTSIPLELVSASDNSRLLADQPRPPVKRWIGLGSRSSEALKLVVSLVPVTSAFPVSTSPFSSTS